jgi:hypothetical protein
MKLFVVLLSLVISSFAFAEDGGAGGKVLLQESVRFSYSSNRSYYHCDYFERQAQRMVRALGGERVDVRCSGGLPYQSFLSGSVESVASVSADRSKSAEVQIRIDEACEFNDKLMKAILKSSTRILSVKKRGSCMNSQGRVRYTITVLQ